MDTYYIFILLVILQYVVLKSNKNLRVNRSMLVNLMCIELIFFASMRSYNVGADTIRYVTALEEYCQYSAFEIIKAESIYPYRFELGYFWFTKLCALFNLNYSLFLLIIACIIYIPTFKLINKYSPFPLLSLLIYFGFELFSYSLGLLRQFIALSIVLIGLDNLFSKKFLRWLFYVFLASLFHQSAIICLAYWVINRFNFKRILILSVLLQPVFLFFGRYILIIVFSLSTFYNPYIGSIHDNVNSSYIMLVMYDLLLLVCIYHQFCLKRINTIIFDFAIKSVPVICCLQALAYSLGIFGRVLMYFSIFNIVLIPMLIKDIFNKQQAFFIAGITGFAFIILFVIRTFSPLFISEYTFFWEI